MFPSRSSYLLLTRRDTYVLVSSTLSSTHRACNDILASHTLHDQLDILLGPHVVREASRTMLRPEPRVSRMARLEVGISNCDREIRWNLLAALLALSDPRLPVVVSFSFPVSTRPLTSSTVVLTATVLLREGNSRWHNIVRCSWFRGP